MQGPVPPSQRKPFRVASGTLHAGSMIRSTLGHPSADGFIHPGDRSAGFCCAPRPMMGVHHCVSH